MLPAPSSVPIALLPEGRVNGIPEIDVRPYKRRRIATKVAIGLSVALACFALMICGFALKVSHYGSDIARAQEPSGYEATTSPPTTSSESAAFDEEVSDFEFSPSSFEEAMALLFKTSPLTVSELDNIIDGGKDSAFLFSHDGTCALGTEASSLLSPAMSAMEGGLSSYKVGFLFADIESGRGYGCNIDQDIYGASTIKAILALYILEQADAGSIAITSSIRSLLHSSLAYSDNDAFISLSARFARSSSSFRAWLESAGVPSSFVNAGDFATYCVRDGAKLWLRMGRYLASGTDNAAWLSGVLADTNLSPIRDAVEKYSISQAPSAALPSEGGIPYEGYPDVSSYGAVVLNKAGWISGSSSALCDNAIIECNGRRYLMCIMSSAPYSDSSMRQVSALAASLLDARSILCLGQAWG